VSPGEWFPPPERHIPEDSDSQVFHFAPFQVHFEVSEACGLPS
jgi:hypothetical protein